MLMIIEVLIAFLRELKLIFYSTKNKCIFSREKLKLVNDIPSLDLDLSRSFSTYLLGGFQMIFLVYLVYDCKLLEDLQSPKSIL